jgi:hypothetical protein
MVLRTRAGDPERVPKASWVTRRLPVDFRFEWAEARVPTVGDLLLCEILQPSLHGRLETRSGERSRLYPGDHVVCAVGARYATSLLEGAAEIDGEFADLLSASGLCGRVLERTAKTPRATSLRVLGQAFDGGRPVNLRSFGLPAPPLALAEPVWVLVVGSAMDSGKTTACTTLINGFARSGLRVGAAKLTGTASLRDLHAFRDAGAEPALDFLDCGWPSTCGCSPTELHEIAATLCGELARSAVDVAVLEIADGLLQSETNTLLAHLHDLTGTRVVILTARESLAAVAGVDLLTAQGYAVAAVSGVVTSSPLAAREVELATGIACIATSELDASARALIGLDEEAGRPQAVRQLTG